VNGHELTLVVVSPELHKRDSHRFSLGTTSSGSRSIVTRCSNAHCGSGSNEYPAGVLIPVQAAHHNEMKPPTSSNSPAKASTGSEKSNRGRLDPTPSPVTQIQRPARLATVHVAAWSLRSRRIQSFGSAEKAFHDALARRNEAQIAYFREPSILTREALEAAKTAEAVALEILNAEVRWLASTRATSVIGLKLKASCASTGGKLADSIIEDILQL
jgi:hypothetical protein